MDLNATLAKVQDSLQPMIVETGAEVRASRLPTVLGSESLLRMVLKNLLENAIKYSKSRAPRIVITAEEGSEEHVISVADNGMGIPAEMVERIFDFGVRAQEDHEAEGSGIGLAFCRRVLESHGGRIWAESKLNQGSVFSFAVPKSPPQAQGSFTDRPG